MVQPALVHGLTLRDLTFRASPNWSIHPLLCTDVLATNITIESGQFDGDAEYSGHNVDGIIAPVVLSSPFLPTTAPAPPRPSRVRSSPSSSYSRE